MSIVENYYSSLIYPNSNLLRPTLIDAILVHRPVIDGRSCSFVILQKMLEFGKPLTV